ncbi:AhpC/TSA family protein [Flavobacterium sp. CF108]|uniref:peroxiredoxin family protein n=1 Tax=unclassified Flavobacterium TaxID=196869 RepID=UPI0008C13721|nr:MULTISPECIES: redoxin domain-containing protein [unclassified Flavobacterium]SEO62524.1 AhpC/TSA family protein [Flavobacterium sp. fv08]SHH95696.1 AhpC/TSA family protein [Flavobacterium sp. CF108]
MKNILLRSLAVFGVMTSVQAQTINVNFSHYGGKQYVYVLERGSKKDTIATGKLDPAGKAVLVIPQAKKGYAGISHFVLTDGGGMDFIVNKENFSISCLEEQPNFENTKYTGSPENDFLNQKIQQQKAILDKAGFVNYGLNLYKKEEPLHTAFQKENENLQGQFTALQNETAKSTLYAARFIEIYRFLMGIGSSFNQPEEEKAKELNLFVKEKLDMQVLYNSGFWNQTIEGWVNLQQMVIKDDAVLLADTKQILSRIKSNEIYTAFTEKIVAELTKEGKDEMVTAISQYTAKSGRLEKLAKQLTNAINAPVIGSLAPALQTAAGKKTINKKTLLFFYESGCNNCENEIHQLLGNYEIVKNKGYEIISVAADMTKNAGDHSHEFPWKEQLCDYKGFAGPNFQTYAIIGTPTFFTIDEKGKITGKYARLIDTKIINN